MENDWMWWDTATEEQRMTAILSTLASTVMVEQPEDEDKDDEPLVRPEVTINGR